MNNMSYLSVGYIQEGEDEQCQNPMSYPQRVGDAFHLHMIGVYPRLPLDQRTGRCDSFGSNVPPI